MESANYKQTSRVESRRQKKQDLLIPRQLLKEAILKCLDIDGHSETVIGDLSAAFAAPSILLRPTDGGKSFAVRVLTMQRVRNTISLVDDEEDEDADEESQIVDASLRSLPVVEDVFDCQPDGPAGIPKMRARASSTTTFSTESYTPRYNCFGVLNIIICPPAKEGFIRVTLDNASDMNLMPARMLERLKIPEELVQNCYLEIETAKGIAEAYERVRLSFEIDGWHGKYKAWFYILPDKDMRRQGILGHKFLSRHRLYPKDGILAEVMEAQADAANRVEGQ